MPCYCPVAGKEENDWAIKSHPKVQKEAADCFFLFWKLPFASETAIFGDVIYIFFCRQRICRLRHRENVRLIFINFVWVFFLSCRRNGIVEQCEHGGRRRPQDRETPPSASSPSFFFVFFLFHPPTWRSSSVERSYHSETDCIMFIFRFFTLALFFLLLLRPAALVYSVSKESKMGDRKGFSQCPFWNKSPSLTLRKPSTLLLPTPEWPPRWQIITS